jgi:hypothetical protein
MAVLNPSAPAAAAAAAAGSSASAQPPPPGYPPGLHSIDARRIEKETFLGRVLSLGPQVSDFIKQGAVEAFTCLEKGSARAIPRRCVRAGEDILEAWMDVRRAGDGSDGMLQTDNGEPDAPDATPEQIAAAKSGQSLTGVARLLPPVRDESAALAFKRLQVKRGERRGVWRCVCGGGGGGGGGLPRFVGGIPSALHSILCATLYHSSLSPPRPSQMDAEEGIVRELRAGLTTYTLGIRRVVDKLLKRGAREPVFDWFGKLLHANRRRMQMAYEQAGGDESRFLALAHL